MRIKKEIIMKRVHPSWLIAGILALGAANQVEAQSRTWAFSKDTAYEWQNKSDSVFLTNSGADTLRFDSIGLEFIRPSDAPVVQASFFVRVGGSIGLCKMMKYQGSVSYLTSTKPSFIVVPPGLAVIPYQFAIETQLGGVAGAKSSAIVQGDTLIVRLIFMAAAGRGRDTLFVKGREGDSSLVPLRSSQKIPQNSFPPNRFFDLRGRGVEPIPAGLKAPWAPLVSPRE
jgi:hypothetical protein